MALKADQIATASPAVGAVGVDSSLQPNGSYGEYDVTISVTYSPKAGQMAIVANKTERMSAKKFAAFREDTNEWDGRQFLQEYFPGELKEALANAEAEKAPQVYIVQGNPTPVPAPANVAALSSVETQPAFGDVVKADVTKAPKPPKEEDYQSPAGGADSVNEGNVETNEHQNDSEPMNESGLKIDDKGDTVSVDDKKAKK